MTKKIFNIDFEEILNTHPAKTAWKQYREYLKSDTPLWTKIQKQQKHTIYWEWLNALAKEPVEVKLKIGELYCQVFDGIYYIDSYTGKPLEKFLDQSIQIVRSIINLYLYKDYETNPTKLRWLALYATEHVDPYSSQPLPSPPISLLHQALKINPNDLNCKKTLFYYNISVIASTIQWADNFEFHYHVERNDLEDMLNDSIHWAKELHQSELWNKIIKKARLEELNQAILDYFSGNYPLRKITFMEYLKLNEKFQDLIKHWPSWFQFRASDFQYSDDILTDIRLMLESLYQAS